MRKATGLYIFVLLLSGHAVFAQGILLSRIKTKPPLQTFVKGKADFCSPVIYILPKSIPEDYYTRNFGFFCRRELKMEKTGTAVHFRLGSMEYCNQLENKTAIAGSR